MKLYHETYGQSGVPMQRLLIAVPDPEEPAIDTVRLTVKKLEAGTNKPMAGVTFKIENAQDPAAFSVTRQTGADGAITLTKEADDLSAGQYQITEETQADGTITVSNVTEGYYQFREVSVPAGFDCDRFPVGVHVNAEDLKGSRPSWSPK